MTSEQQRQRQMHKDFFDRCRDALEHGFYMEAILMEYAAIEARMEILLGILGLPCNKFLDDKERKSIQISHRIQCASNLRKSSEVFRNTKLSKKYFENLSKWVTKRNEYIHGLYKNEMKYSARIADAEHYANQGMEYCRLLYNEVNRLKRLHKTHPEKFDNNLVCNASKCSLNRSRTEAGMQTIAERLL